MNEAILFITYNRPAITNRVFDQIRKVRPPRLYLASDGPRLQNVKDLVLVNQVRKIITEIDWPCKVSTLFRKNNLGCKFAVSSAINWFFENESRGIILEDDCLPNDSFFEYCEELLEVYQNDNEIFLISGENIIGDEVIIEGDYSFIRYPCIWGWASWSRAWKKYDLELSQWPLRGSEVINKYLLNKDSKRFWRDVFNDCYKNKIDTWDYQVCFAMLLNGAKCIIPKKNLVSNIGFGDDATHTRDVSSRESLLQTYSVNFPLNHNTFLNDEINLNLHFDRKVFYKLSFLMRIKNKLRAIIHG
jgi:hypothetical protein